MLKHITHCSTILYRDELTWIANKMMTVPIHCCYIYITVTVLICQDFLSPIIIPAWRTCIRQHYMFISKLTMYCHQIQLGFIFFCLLC
jgi:hypothetical protein